MKRYFVAFGLFALITFAASCKKDDGDTVAPPRDYAVQYASEKDSIEKYLKNHYIVSVDEDFNVILDSIDSPGTQTSIWDQTEYPLQSKIVKSTNTANLPEYTVYYIMLNQGVGDAPTRGDNVLISYRGSTLSDVQFDYQPFPQTSFSLATTIEGWQNIIPLFKAGIYVDVPGSPDPANYENYGAGIMFLPSGLGYYNAPTSALIPTYGSLVFSFKLYAVQYVDSDSDGLLNRYEMDSNGDLVGIDTDGDGIPNYLDNDDDGDGYLTRTEITIPNTNPAQYYEFGSIPTCTEGGSQRHLDASCH